MNKLREKLNSSFRTKSRFNKEVDISLFPSRIPMKDQAIFAKRLSFLIKAGVPIINGLQTLKRQTRSVSKARIFDQIIDDVSNGQYLSASLAKSGRVFGGFAINMIRVGEEGGMLDQNLHYLSEELKKRYILRKKVRGALVYPIFVTVITIGITALITTFVFPKILPIFQNLGGTLPLATRALVFISEFLLNYGAYILLGLVALVLGSFMLYKTIKPFRYVLDRTALSLPIFGHLVRNYQLANTCRTLGILLKSNLNVVGATSITSETLSNDVYKREIENLSKSVLKGKRISEHLEGNLYLFPEIMLQTITVGETSGNLVDSLMYLSDYYENEVDDITKNLSSSIEPVLMVFLGMIVGFVAVAVITPIYEITQYIHP